MSDRLFPRLQTMEEFHAWLQESELRKEWFQEQIPENLRLKLDMSFESLESLGNWLCEHYSNLYIENPSEIKNILEGAGYYVGETFIKNFGGKWSIKFEPPDLAYRGDPGISDYKRSLVMLMPDMIYPRYWVSTSLFRKDPQFISRRFLQHKKGISW